VQLCHCVQVLVPVLVDHNTLRQRRHRSSDCSSLDVARSGISDVRETAILTDDNAEDCGCNDARDCDVTTTTAAAAADVATDDVESNCAAALLHKTCRRPVPTLVLANGDISCDVTLLKEVSKLEL